MLFVKDAKPKLNVQFLKELRILLFVSKVISFVYTVLLENAGINHKGVNEDFVLIVSGKRQEE